MEGYQWAIENLVAFAARIPYTDASWNLRRFLDVIIRYRNCLLFIEWSYDIVI